MRLTVPTDFDILQTLADGKRNNAINIAAELDRNRSYINTRLPILTDFGLVERVGPAPNSGLYVITPKGKIVANHREEYEDSDIDFEPFVQQQLEAQSETDEETT